MLQQHKFLARIMSNNWDNHYIQFYDDYNDKTALEQFLPTHLVNGQID